MEDVIAPKIALNHNETLVSDEIELDVEELEEVIAPRLSANHNETLTSEEVESGTEEQGHSVEFWKKRTVEHPVHSENFIPLYFQTLTGIRY